MTITTFPSDPIELARYLNEPTTQLDAVSFDALGEHLMALPILDTARVLRRTVKLSCPRAACYDQPLMLWRGAGKPGPLACRLRAYFREHPGMLDQLRQEEKETP